MSIRDTEIDRLTKYCQALGLTVNYRRYKPGDPGAEVVAVEGVPTTVNIYIWPGKSKTHIVLDFIHELAHMVSYIYNGRRDSQDLLDALTEEDQRKPGQSPIAKWKRKLIYDCERKDAAYRYNIIKELDIKVPKHKFMADMELDLWIYKYFYITGDYPKREDVRNKKKELKEKYRGQ